MMNSFYDAFRSDLPECNIDGVVVRRFDTRAPEMRLANLRYEMEGRGTRPGVYTHLIVDGELWMSDTDAEARDHHWFFLTCKAMNAKRVLVNGLGMGCIVKALLTLESIEHIDVVEFDQRIIDIIGSHYAKDLRVHITHADAYKQTKQWPKGMTWDAAWHDIWIDICEDNRESMTMLHRSYGHRVKYQESWGKVQMDADRQRYGGW